jgi:hypothetical protein
MTRKTTLTALATLALIAISADAALADCYWPVYRGW